MITEYLDKLRVEGKTFALDAMQTAVVQQLQNLQRELIQEAKKRKRYAFLRKKHLVKGIYLWGGVGIGKTFLLDSFYHSLTIPAKKRMHFFQFMQFIHRNLAANAGKKDPLAIIAKRFAQQVMVLCL